MLLHVNNEMENGVIAKIPLALDKDIKGFQGDAIDFEISSLDGHLIPAEEFHPYKSLFKVVSGNSELKNVYIALSFNLTSGSKFAGAYSASITNPYLYVIKNGSLIDNKISDPIAIKAQFYPSSSHSIITPKEHINIVLSNRQGSYE